MRATGSLAAALRNLLPVTIHAAKDAQESFLAEPEVGI